MSALDAELLVAKALVNFAVEHVVLGERGQRSVARLRISLCVDRLDADLIGAGVEMRPKAARDRRRIAPEHHRIDELYRNRHRRDRLR